MVIKDKTDSEMQLQSLRKLINWLCVEIIALQFYFNIRSKFYFKASCYEFTSDGEILNILLINLKPKNTGISIKMCTFLTVNIGC